MTSFGFAEACWDQGRLWVVYSVVPGRWISEGSRCSFRRSIVEDIVAGRFFFFWSL